MANVVNGHSRDGIMGPQPSAALKPRRALRARGASPSTIAVRKAAKGKGKVSSSPRRNIMNAGMDPRKIADEAVGQRPEGAIPDAVQEQMTAPISDRAIRERAASAGPRASIAEKTAEAMGERSGGAYAHQNAVAWWPEVGGLPLISAAAAGPPWVGIPVRFPSDSAIETGRRL